MAVKSIIIKSMIWHPGLFRCKQDNKEVIYICGDFMIYDLKTIAELKMNYILITTIGNLLRQRLVRSNDRVNGIIPLDTHHKVRCKPWANSVNIS